MTNTKDHVIQITVIDCKPEQQSEALSVMKDRARFMSTQPGCISIHLYRSLDERRIVNHLEWQTRDLLEAAHKHPEFRKEWDHFSDVTIFIDPHLYEVAALT